MLVTTEDARVENARTAEATRKPVEGQGSSGEQRTPRDSERVHRIVSGLKAQSLDALLCALPAHVLLVSGYWPVIGASLAFITSDAKVVIIAPEDEQELAESGYADEVITYKPMTLERTEALADAVRRPVEQAAAKLGISQKRIGFEFGAASEPASYAAMNLFSGTLPTIVRHVIPRAYLQPADSLLAGLAAVKTPTEVQRIREACEIAAAAFERASNQLRPGITETQAAALVRDGFSMLAPDLNRQRADGFAWCMSGPHSAKAAAAYARSRDRELAEGDLVLLHANSYNAGYWTDITRTYIVGQLDDKQRKIYDAILEARDAALEVVRPGVRASRVDLAVRSVLSSHGFGKQFPHPAGHGVGFVAISANARPRIHPASREELQVGMVFNLEPAVYIEGYGGVRLCNMVAVGEPGAELLTPFQNRMEELILAA